VVPPRAGTVCFPRFKPDTLGTSELSAWSAKEAGVNAGASAVFDYGERQPCASASGRENFPDGLLRLSAFLT